MSSVKAVLRKDKINSNGLAPVYIRVIQNRKTNFVRIDNVLVSPADWDDSAEKVKKSKRVPNSVRLNNLIAVKKLEIGNYLIESETNSQKYNPGKLKRIMTGRSEESFTQFANGYLKSLDNPGHIRMHKRVKSILKKLSEYAEGDLTFGEIDIDFLKSYKEHLLVDKGNCINTVLSNFKILRKIFNDAVREDIVSYENNPFRKFKFQWENTSVEYLTEKEIEAIDMLELSYSTKIWHTRNMYVFACYAGGIRIGDLLALKWCNISETHISLTTQKTGVQIEFALPKRAREILDLYRNNDSAKTDYVFPFLKEQGHENVKLDIERKTAYVNKLLKDIAKKAEIEKKIHFHTSRHTFAVRAIKKGMGIYQLSKILTHSSVKTTQIYVNIANEDIDRAILKAFE